MIANPEIIQHFSNKKRCWSCKHKFAEPVLLPGKMNINPKALFHLYDTHGQDPEVVRQWIIGAVYGMELTEMGAK